MTALPSVPGTSPARTTNGHHRPSHSRRVAGRRSHEKALALLALAVAFAITVALLTIQWLSSQSQGTSVPAPRPSATGEVNWA